MNNLYIGTYNINHCLSDRGCHKASHIKSEDRDNDEYAGASLSGVASKDDGKEARGGGGKSASGFTK